MSKKDLSLFLSELNSNQKLQNVVNSIVGGNLSIEEKQDHLLKFAKSNNFNFTKEEAFKLKNSLSNEDLENIAGGIGKRTTALTLSALTCLSLAGASSSLFASASDNENMPSLRGEGNTTKVSTTNNINTGTLADNNYRPPVKVLIEEYEQKFTKPTTPAKITNEIKYLLNESKKTTLQKLTMFTLLKEYGIKEFNANNDYEKEIIELLKVLPSVSPDNEKDSSIDTTSEELYKEFSKEASIEDVIDLIRISDFNDNNSSKNSSEIQNLLKNKIKDYINNSTSILNTINSIITSVKNKSTGEWQKTTAGGSSAYLYKGKDNTKYYLAYTYGYVVLDRSLKYCTSLGVFSNSYENLNNSNLEKELNMHRCVRRVLESLSNEYKDEQINGIKIKDALAIGAQEIMPDYNNDTSDSNDDYYTTYVHK